MFIDTHIFNILSEIGQFEVILPFRARLILKGRHTKPNGG
jgi:hypothetical protein